jgi:hypothetical protein
MARIVIGLALAGLLEAGVAGNAAAAIIYGSVYVGPTGTSSETNLWAFSPGNPPNSFARIIGPMGFRRVGAIDFAPDGTLYGVGSDGTRTVLIRINTTTGQGVLVGPLGLGDANVFVMDIAFRPSDGVLFAFAEPGIILTINTTTGAATILGDAGIGFPFGNSLAFQGTTLFYANESALYTIDQTTGVATFVRNIIYQEALGPNARPPAMKFDPGDGTLWISVVGFGQRKVSLGTLDPATGQTTFVAPLPVITDGIAVTTGTLPPFVIVPTLSQWAQLAMVAALVVVGLEALRRRRLPAPR